jgi:hypothetical protein
MTLEDIREEIINACGDIKDAAVRDKIRGLAARISVTMETMSPEEIEAATEKGDEVTEADENSSAD